MTYKEMTRAMADGVMLLMRLGLSGSSSFGRDIDSFNVFMRGLKVKLYDPEKTEDNVEEHNRQSYKRFIEEVSNLLGLDVVQSELLIKKTA